MNELPLPVPSPTQQSHRSSIGADETTLGGSSPGSPPSRFSMSPLLGRRSQMPSPHSPGSPCSLGSSPFPASLGAPGRAAAGGGNGGADDDWESQAIKGVAEMVNNVGQDIEKERGPDGSAEGWPAVAAFMSEARDFRAFPRFERANIMTLLYYQVEIATLESELRVQQESDREDMDYLTHADKMVPETWKLVDDEHNPRWELTDETDAGSGQAGLPADTRWPTGRNCVTIKRRPSQVQRSDQWDIILRLRKTVRDYNEALIQFHTISQISSPSNQNVKVLREKTITGEGALQNKVQGNGSHSWDPKPDAPPPPPRLGDPHTALVSVGGPRGSDDDCDGFSLWLKRDVAAWLARTWPKSSWFKEDHLGLCRIEGRRILNFSAAVTTVFASALPVAGIAILAAVKPLPIRIGIIAAFSCVVSVSLLLFTTCKRKDVFMITAAFSAVLVVFVQDESTPLTT